MQVLKAIEVGTVYFRVPKDWKVRPLKPQIFAADIFLSRYHTNFSYDGSDVILASRKQFGQPPCCYFNFDKQKVPVNGPKDGRG
jgi:hypothetical protein